MTAVNLKTRFAPSPTGLIHLGNARTALFNALLALGQQGVFLLRIEDTDKARSDESFTQGLMTDLQWMGLAWQEGPGHDLGNGPYWQSQRQAIYDRYYTDLQSANLAYPCFCTEQQLAIARKVQLASGKPPRYPGTCRHLSPEQVGEKLAKGMEFTLRFAVPLNEQVVFQDLVRGEQRFNTNDLGDFIIRRTDGTPPFMYCNAIDDALMGVTHALRGEDHLTNTPRQILILQALKLPVPHYGHISLIVGQDGSPLSKRHGSRSIQELRETGFLPEAIVNYLARLGHYYADDSFMPLSQLAVQFNVSHLGAAPAKFDANQMWYWQRTAVAQLSEERLWQWLGAKVQQLVPDEFRNEFITAVRSNITLPEDGLRWARILFENNLPIPDENKPVLQQAGTAFFQTAMAAVDQHGTDYQAVNQVLQSKLGIKGKMLFQPLRVALTGELHGPEMAKVFHLLGKEKMLQRLGLWR